MPTYNSEIENFVVGDDLDIVRSISNIPTGQTVTEAVLTIKVFESGATALIEKTITAVLSDDGLISDTGASGIAEVTFTLTDTDTALLSPGNWHYFDIQVTTSAGKIYTPEKGKIKGEIGIT